MLDPTTKPDAFWRDLEQLVASKTVAVLNTSDRMREPVIEYLREVEKMARSECRRRETIQVIASARRVLGDRSEVSQADGPFAHSLGSAP